MMPVPHPAGPPEDLCRLEAILATDSGRAQAKVRRRFEEAFQGRGGRAVLFGAGALGHAVQHGLRVAGLELLAFADNDPAKQGTEQDGLPVLAPEEAFRRHGATVVFIVTVFGNGPVLAQLEAAGVRHLPLSVVAWRFPEVSRWWWPDFFPDGVAPLASRIRQAFGLLADDASREEFLGQLAWRCTLDRDRLPPHLPADQTYFPPDLIPLGTGEVFVDCGAFDGDTLRAFLRRQPLGPAFFVGVEPDEASRARLEALVAERPAGTSRIVGAVLGAQGGQASFAQGGGTSSRIEEGGTPLPRRTLDEVLAGLRPTLVKMDIEGAEVQAIQGARETLRHLPALAIATYHHASDLWEIPLAIQETAPGYAIALRRHAEECWELITYARRLP